jgi:hypothetical protein
MERPQRLNDTARAEQIGPESKKAAYHPGAGSVWIDNSSAARTTSLGFRGGQVATSACAIS